VWSVQIYSGVLARWARRGRPAASTRSAVCGAEEENLRAREQEEHHVRCTGERVKGDSNEGREGWDGMPAEGNPARDR